MNFFKLSYWFMTNPGPLVPSVRTAFIIFIVILAILTAVFFVLRRKNKKKLINRAYKKLYNFSFTNFALSLILLFFTDQDVPVFSSRFWFLLLLMEMIIWLYFIGKVYREVPKILEQQKKDEEFRKYIP